MESIRTGVFTPPLLHFAQHREIDFSLLTGVVANCSVVTGKEVRIDDLVKDIGMPEYPVMPSHADPTFDFPLLSTYLESGGSLHRRLALPDRGVKTLICLALTRQNTGKK